MNVIQSQRLERSCLHPQAGFPKHPPASAANILGTISDNSAEAEQGSGLTLVRGVWEKREKPSNRYSWSSYSITVGLSV